MGDARESYRRELRRELDELRRIERARARRELDAWIRRVLGFAFAVAAVAGLIGFLIGLAR